MGLFDSIKQNFTQGGVEVRIHAPASVSMEDASMPVGVTLTASDATQTINRVRVELIAETNAQSFSQPGDANSGSGYSSQTVAQIEDNTVIVLGPGETKEIQLAIAMNQGALLGEQLPEGSGMAQVASMIEKLQNVSSALNQSSYRYHVKATADVEGVAFDPSDTQSIQILKPGQMGAGFNMHT